MIIDTHCHIYPDKIAAKASKAIESFYDIPVAYDGKVSTLLEADPDNTISRYLVHSVATTPVQVESINNFIIRTVSDNPSRFTGFGAMHPAYEDPAREIDRIIANGLSGIKLHPDFQEFMIDDEKAWPIYEACEGRIPILFHMGDVRYEFSKAARLANVLDRFPKLTVIGAHFAGYSEWDAARHYLEGRRIYVDTSSSMFRLRPEEARKLIDFYGTDRVLFASDYPMWDPLTELKKIHEIPMTKEEADMIFFKNACRLLKLPEK